MNEVSENKMIQTLPMRLSPLLILMMLSACATTEPQQSTTLKKINDELNIAAEVKENTPTPAAISEALLPPLKIAMPKASAKQLEQRFDLVINNAPASQVLMGIVSGTRYSMLVHQDVTGMISVNLKDVTVFEALDSLRDLYGYEYKVDGTRIFISKQGIQAKLYKINYISGIRRGSSDINVTSGSNSNGGTSGTTSSGRQSTASTLSMSSRTDFWGEIEDSVRTVIQCDIPSSTSSETTQSAVTSATAGSAAATGGATRTAAAESIRYTQRDHGTKGCPDGKAVVINQMADTMLIRAMPDELRTIDSLLHMMQVNVEKQVILEAKIIDVQLNDGAQQGINWSVLKNGMHRASVGADTTTINASTSSTGGAIVTSTTLGAQLGSGMIGVAGNAFSTGLGIALQAGNVSAMLNFLETQGKVNVLSSPRIATLNNQKAILKVGTDEQFVTGFDSSNNNTVATTGGTVVNSPTPQYSTYFSGISLDVTPQIDDEGNITLHVHPLISNVTEVNKMTINNQTLPFASNNISETDSVVKVKDGQIVVIGGLMTESFSDNNANVPGLGNVPVVGALFRKTGKTMTKRELVIMIKPTIVQDRSWTDAITETQQSIEDIQRPEVKAGSR